MHSFRCVEGRHRGYGWDDFADQEEKPPRCPECGDYLRPEVVWFGEGLPPDALNAAQQLSAGCDVMLIVGTSGVVYPAAAMPMIAGEAGADGHRRQSRSATRSRRWPTSSCRDPAAKCCRGWSRPSASTWATDPGRYSFSPGRRPAAARRTTSAMRRARVSGRFASSTQYTYWRRGEAGHSSQRAAAAGTPASAASRSGGVTSSLPDVAWSHVPRRFASSTSAMPAGVMRPSAIMRPTRATLLSLHTLPGLRGVKRTA